MARTGFARRSKGYKLAAGAPKKYPPGKPVEVSFNPANPAEAGLERRVSGGGLIYLIAFTLLAAAGKAGGLY